MEGSNPGSFPPPGVQDQLPTIQRHSPNLAWTYRESNPSLDAVTALIYRYSHLRMAPCCGVLLAPITGWGPVLRCTFDYKAGAAPAGFCLGRNEGRSIPKDGLCLSNNVKVGVCWVALFNVSEQDDRQNTFTYTNRSHFRPAISSFLDIAYILHFSIDDRGYTDNGISYTSGPDRGLLTDPEILFSPNDNCDKAPGTFEFHPLDALGTTTKWRGLLSWMGQCDPVRGPLGSRIEHILCFQTNQHGVWRPTYAGILVGLPGCSLACEEVYHLNPRDQKITSPSKKGRDSNPEPLSGRHGSSVQRFQLRHPSMVILRASARNRTWNHSLGASRDFHFTTKAWSPHSESNRSLIRTKNAR